MLLKLYWQLNFKRLHLQHVVCGEVDYLLRRLFAIDFDFNVVELGTGVLVVVRVRLVNVLSILFEHLSGLACRN